MIFLQYNTCIIYVKSNWLHNKGLRRIKKNMAQMEGDSVRVEAKYLTI